MGHDHSHTGHQHAHEESTKNLGIAFFLNLGFAVIEIVGGNMDQFGGYYFRCGT